MARWEFVERTAVADQGALELFRREMAQGTEFAIRIAGQPGDLMNSRVHGSEDALGTLPFVGRQLPTRSRVLIGGLGMGFTLAAALGALPADARVTVAELVPGVVAWNEGVLAACAGNPLRDPRVTVVVQDVYELVSAADCSYEAILLDVDNGPEGLTHVRNDRLYSTEGLARAHHALTSRGVLAVWSVSPDRRFVTRLRRSGFRVDERRVRAHQGKGARHVIWLAQKR